MQGQHNTSVQRASNAITKTKKNLHTLNGALSGTPGVGGARLGPFGNDRAVGPLGKGARPAAGTGGGDTTRVIGLTACPCDEPAAGAGVAEVRKAPCTSLRASSVPSS